MDAAEPHHRRHFAAHTEQIPAAQPGVDANGHRQQRYGFCRRLDTSLHGLFGFQPVPFDFRFGVLRDDIQQLIDQILVQDIGVCVMAQQERRRMLMRIAAAIALVCHLFADKISGCARIADTRSKGDEMLELHQLILGQDAENVRRDGKPAAVFAQITGARQVFQVAQHPVIQRTAIGIAFALFFESAAQFGCGSWLLRQTVQHGERQRQFLLLVHRVQRVAAGQTIFSALGIQPFHPRVLTAAADKCVLFILREDIVDQSQFLIVGFDLDDIRRFKILAGEKAV